MFYEFFVLSHLLNTDEQPAYFKAAVRQKLPPFPFILNLFPEGCFSRQPFYFSQFNLVSKGWLDRSLNSRRLNAGYT